MIHLKNHYLKVLVFLSLPLIFPQLSFSEMITLRGTVVCEREKSRGPRPAKYILVYPEQFFRESKLTAKNGAYRLRLPKLEAIDREISIEYRNSKEKLEEREHSLFISEEDMINLERVELKAECKDVEHLRKVMSRELKSAKEGKYAHKKKRGLDYASGGGFLAGLFGGSLSGVGATALGSVAGAATATTAQVTSISPSRLKKGRLLSYSRSLFSSNTGFNTTPKRNMSEAVFWNASAISMSYFDQVSASWVFDPQFLRFSGTYRIKDSFGVGIGALFLEQEEERSARVKNPCCVPTDTTSLDNFKAKEQGIFLSASLRLKGVAKDRISLGITGKQLVQNIEIPLNIVPLRRTNGVLNITSIKRQEKRTTYDFDLSSTFKLSKKTTLGANILNVAGKKLLDEDDLVIGKTQKISQREFAVGVVHQLKRVQLASEVFYREEEGTDIAVGVNYVPLNSAQIQAGYDTTFDALVLGVKYGIFSYTFHSSHEVGDSSAIGLDYKF